MAGCGMEILRCVTGDLFSAVGPYERVQVEVGASSPAPCATLLSFFYDIALCSQVNSGPGIHTQPHLPKARCSGSRGVSLPSEWASVPPLITLHQYASC